MNRTQDSLLQIGCSYTAWDGAGGLWVFLQRCLALSHKVYGHLTFKKNVKTKVEEGGCYSEDLRGLIQDCRQVLATLGDPNPGILQRNGTYITSFKKQSKSHGFLLKWHPSFSCLSCDEHSLGSKRHKLKIPASSQEAAITAKAGERRRDRSTSPPFVKTASYFMVRQERCGTSERKGLRSPSENAMVMVRTFDKDEGTLWLPLVTL